MPSLEQTSLTDISPAVGSHSLGHPACLSYSVVTCTVPSSGGGLAVDWVATATLLFPAVVGAGISLAIPTSPEADGMAVFPFLSRGMQVVCASHPPLAP